MGASENFGNPTKEQIAQWENEGGNIMTEKSPEQKKPTHPLGRIFFQEQFLKVLSAQTLFNKVIWRQAEGFFQTPNGVYTEIWETTVSGIRITVHYFESMGIAGKFLKKSIKRGGKQVDIDLTYYLDYPEISYGLNFFEVAALSLSLYQEIKLQHDREIRKWHSEHTDVVHSLDVSGFENLLVSLTNALI